MIDRGSANPTWPWVVSCGFHGMVLAALWIGSVVAIRAGGSPQDAAPRLIGANVAAAAHQSSSLGDLTDEEGFVTLTASASSPDRLVVMRPPASKEPRPAAARPKSDPPATGAATADRNPVGKASPQSSAIRRAESSLPPRKAETPEIAEKIAVHNHRPHVPPQATARPQPVPEGKLPRTLPHTGSMAAVASVLAMAPVAAIEDAETGGGRSIRRGGHLGRDGSVGSDGSLPEALANIPPVYPEIARQNGWAGTVSLRLWIGASGSVERLEVATSSGHAALDAAAVEAVRSWRFRPALRGGSPIAVTVLLPVVFDLKRGPGVSEISTSMSR